MEQNRQRRRTRSALMVAGEQLFAVRSYDCVTVDQIVASADVAKGSFYNHFSDKAALMEAVLEVAQRDIEEGVSAIMQGMTDPAERIASGFCWFVEYGRSQPFRLQALLRLADQRLAADSPLNARLVVELQAAISSRRMSGIDVETGVLVMGGLARATLVQSLADDRKGGRQRLAETACHALLRALGVETKEASAISKASARSIVATAI